MNERLLEQVNLKYNLEICIHRPSTIIREGNDAITTKAEFDWVNALIQYSHQTKTVPLVQHSSGAFDLAHVKSVCSDIIRKLLEQKSKSANGISYVNNVGDLIISMNKLEAIGLVKGEQYTILSMQRWAQKAIAAGLHPAVAALIETFDEPVSPAYPALLKDRQ